MRYEISELDRMLSGLLIPGVVSAVDAGKARVRIASDGWVSSWIPWLGLAAGKARHWRLPSVGEQALMLNPSGEPDNGFALVGFYTDALGHDGRANVVAWQMPDGCKIEYDFTAGAALINGCKAVTVNAAESVTVKATTITLDADNVIVTQNLTVGAAINHLANGGAKASFGGAIEAKGDVSAGDISLMKHAHREQGDGQMTSEAV
ncbi:phage baseplate assembly protein V [Janthinobacterium sp. B9-8]|uniref:phage baseplate assembly protein V n=1 Tax=Janthinobacterium sp. B9-8 TaxID=1236179 RepID=UPI00069B40F6|nr:phage baseplate assembly protein V [Janthinobacterium sp. B9-8]AMC35434.1 hypothetical protein VN23_12825 [Janthinobacterium sp. B9-8]